MATPRTSRRLEEVRVVRRNDEGFAPSHRSGHVLLLVTAAITFWLAYDSGSYGLVSRTGVAIVVWWAIVLAAVVLSETVRPIGRAALVTGSALAGFAVWTLASVGWAPNASAVFAEFDRVALAFGVFLIAAVVSTRQRAPRLSDGIALGIALIALIALGSRFVPSVIASGSSLQILQVSGTRLSYPVGYWNGLGALLAIGVPLVLRIAVADIGAAARAAAVASLPAIAATIYLTSSRGAAIEAAIAVFVFFLVCPWRVRTLIAAGAGLLATVPLILYFRHAPVIVDGPFDTHAAHHAGAIAAAIFVASAAAVAVVYWYGVRLVESRVPSTQRLERPLVVAALLLVCVGFAVSHPAQRFNDFKNGPVESTPSQHFVSASGNGRWQMWGIAMREYRHHPVLGGGAGSYGTWWLQYRTSATFVQNAHSFYVETLGELGPVGLFLVGVFVLMPLAVGVRRRLAAHGEHALVLAAAIAGFVAWAVAAAVDWVWQIPGVTLPAIVLMALLVTPTTIAGPVGGRRRARLTAARAVIAVAGIAAIAGEAIPLLAQLELDASQTAARRGNGAAAVHHARLVESFAPWAPEGYEQVALLQERLGNLGAARTAIARALSRDGRSWELWLTQARLQTESGQIRVATASLEHAKRLNPVWAEELARAAAAG